MKEEFTSTVFKRVFTLFLIFILLSASCVSPVHAASQAKDIAKQCKLTSSVNAKSVRHMLNGNDRSYWDGADSGILDVSLPKGKKAQGIMITFFCEPPHLQITDKNDNILADWDSGFYIAWIPFSSPANRFTIKRAEEGELIISHLHVLTEGELPAWVQQWVKSDEPVDLLMIVTHPDDDLLWFGGMLPTYAGEKHMKVQVAYMVGGQNRTRRLELLNALWHCGVILYPDIGFFQDKGVYSVKSAYDAWGGQDAVQAYVVRLVRGYKPHVVVTQDLDGEYGHIHHKITAKYVVAAVTEDAINPDVDPDSAARLGVWQPEKLYVHLWKENPVTFDWNLPLPSFENKTSLEIAREAFKLHVSQQTGKYRVSAKGRLSCSEFGLYFSTVGADENPGDLFDHLSDF